MRLILPKPKKFYSPALITQGGGQSAATVFATIAGNNNVRTNATSTGGLTQLDEAVTLPSIPAGAVLVASLHTDSGTISGITLDPAGANVVMTVESGASTRPVICDTLLSGGLTAGAHTFRCFHSNWQFRWIALFVWYITGQTVNSPEAVGVNASGGVVGFGVTAARVMVASAMWGSSNAGTWALSPPGVTPVSSNNNINSIGGMQAAWAQNQTNTNNWTVASGAGNPTGGTLCATYR
jgi:hypothetical protein